MQRDPSSPKMSPMPGTIPSNLPARMPAASPLPFNTPAPEIVNVEELPPPESERRSNLRLDSAWPTGEHDGIPDGAEPLEEGASRPSEPLIEMVPDDDSEGVPVLPALPHQRPATFQGGGQVQDVMASSPPAMHMPVPIPVPMPPPEVDVAPPRKKASRLWTVIFLLLCAGVGIGGVLAWNKWLRDTDSASASEEQQPSKVAENEAATDGAATKQATASVDAAVKTDVKEADEVVPDVITSADALPKKEEAVAPEPTPTPTPTPTPPPSDGPLVIESDPPGARVYVDGADMGKSPAKVATTGDTHTIAVFLPGYELFTAEIGGSGTQKAKLEKAVPTEGSGGIKILCKQKNRYYVSVDGKGTGQLCPTERIGVKVGKYTVEIYDFVTETRKTYDAKVTGTGASRRIRID